MALTRLMASNRPNAQRAPGATPDERSGTFEFARTGFKYRGCRAKGGRRQERPISLHKIRLPHEFGIRSAGFAAASLARSVSSGIVRRRQAYSISLRSDTPRFDLGQYFRQRIFDNRNAGCDHLLQALPA